MTRLLMVSTISTTLATFLLPHVRGMQHEGWIVDGVANGISNNQDCVNTFNFVYEIEWSRSPFDVVHMIKAMKQIKEIVEEGGYDVVHVHTPIASAVTRFALRRMVKTKQIKMMYTAHGFHFYKGAPLLNWLVYYPIEKYLSCYTDVLITINKEDYAIAKNKMHAKHTEYVPGVGIDIEKIKSIEVNRNKKRSELGIPQDAFVLISVGELNKNKNHEIVIKAVGAMKGAQNIHYIIAGQGPLDKYLFSMAERYGLGKRVHLLGFRADVIELLKASDCFVFPSRREGLGIAALEAMASGLPLIASFVGGIKDYMKDGITGCTLQNPLNTLEMVSAITRIRQEPLLGEQCAQNNMEIVKHFSVCLSIDKLLQIYSEVDKL